MGIRRKAREEALQVIYSADFHDCWIEEALSYTLSHFDSKEPKVQAYSARLVFGVCANLKEIDSFISDASRHWSIARMTRIDRCLLRLATFELVISDIPALAVVEGKPAPVAKKTASEEIIPTNVAINEAIELAKLFGTEDSPSFVNGVLDRVAYIQAKKQAA